MSKIIAEKGVLEYCQQAKPGNKAVYVNLDAIINDLPDQFEVILSEVKFDPNNLENDFTNVGTKKKPSWYPQTDLMYAIAKARGVSGKSSDTITEVIYEQVDISEMYLSDVPQIIKKKTGYIIKKVSTVLQEDGTVMPSSVRHGVFNAWEEAITLWHKEEKATEGYNPKLLKEYPSGDKYYEYLYDGKKQQKSLKYDTKWKRTCHFDDLLDVSLGQADTKAHLKTIRELAGLMTGYATDDLKEGKFIFSKVRKSRGSLKLEQAAHLTRIAQGGQASPAANLLFGPEDEAENNNISDAPPEPKEKDVTPEPTPEEELLGIFQSYVNLKELPDDEKQTAVKCIRFLESDPDKDDSYDRLYKKVIAGLKKVELKIDFGNTIDHKFY